MTKYIKSYIKEETALDEAVSKMILICASIGCAMAVGWWIWNTLQAKTAQSNCSNSNSPWCVE